MAAMLAEHSLAVRIPVFHTLALLPTHLSIAHASGLLHVLGPQCSCALSEEVGLVLAACIDLAGHTYTAEVAHNLDEPCLRSAGACLAACPLVVLAHEYIGVVVILPKSRIRSISWKISCSFLFDDRILTPRGPACVVLVSRPCVISLERLNPSHSISSI